MTRFRSAHVACLAVLGLAAGVPAVAAAAPAAAPTATYTITDLGSLGGGVAHGLAINATGQVTGDSLLAKQVMVPCPYPQPPNQKCSANLDHAFFWSNGTMTDLGTLGGNNSQGVAINGSGEVVGASSPKTTGSDQVFLSNARDHKLTALPFMNQALGINDAGQIVGQCNELPANPEVFACVVSSNGTTTQLGDSVPPLGNSNLSCSEAVAINNNGQALANCHGAALPENGAVVWANGTPTVVATLGGSAAGTAINNSGHVVGIAQTGTGAEDGFLWSNGTTTDLGPNFHPAAINDSGVIVGGQFVDSGGTVQNLNTLIPAASGYQIQNATGINDNGQIVANAIHIATGQTHALLLTPS
jgi:probable HAF family extracellular repeat protein